MFLPKRGRFVLLLLLFIGSRIHAQDNFFTRYNTEDVRLKDADWQRYQYISSDAYGQDATIVRTADIRSAQKNGKLSFAFPGSDQTITIEAYYIHEDAENGFSWAGIITGGARGFAAFVQKDGRIGGQISSDGEMYELVPLDANYQVLVRKKFDRSGPTGCGSPPTLGEMPPDITPDPNQCDNEEDCSATLSVLCVITPEAVNELSPVWGAEHSGIYFSLGGLVLNLALMRSDVPNKIVRMKTVKVESYQYFGAGGYSIDLDRIVLPGKLDELRDEYQGDVVVLVTNSRYSDAVGAPFAIGPGFDGAYCIVTVPAFGSAAYFAHEVGHTLGCRHSRDLDPTLACEHAKAHYGVHPNLPGYGYYWRTINEEMPFLGDYEDFAFPDDNGNLVHLDNQGWIPHFSNPNIQWEGISTGGDVTYNAAILRSSICEAADYYPEPELTIAPILEDAACSAPTNFSVTITPPPAGMPGQGPFTVIWQYNFSGVFHWPYPFGSSDVNFGSGTTASLPEPPNCPVYWVRCLVHAADGTTASKVMRIEPGDDCPSCVQFTHPDDRTVAPSPAQAAVQIFPNPVTDRLGIALLQPEQVASLKIFHLQGQLMQSIPVEAGGPYSIPTNALPAGAYLLQVEQADGAVSNHKFVIMK